MDLREGGLSRRRRFNENNSFNGIMVLPLGVKPTVEFNGC